MLLSGNRAFSKYFNRLRKALSACFFCATINGKFEEFFSVNRSFNILFFFKMTSSLFSFFSSVCSRSFSLLFEFCFKFVFFINSLVFFSISFLSCSNCCFSKFFLFCSRFFLLLFEFCFKFVFFINSLVFF